MVFKMQPANIGKSIPKVRQVGQKLPKVPVPHPVANYIGHPHLLKAFMRGYRNQTIKMHQMGGKKGILG